jgi:NAD-dependent deacetylase
MGTDGSVVAMVPHDAGSPADAVVDDVRDLLDRARRGVVFTGAGASTGSGLPDFRSAEGVWTRYDPRRLTFDRYVEDPSVRRDSWRMRREFLDAGAQPNAAHHAIAELEDQGRVATVVTQNIDGLHQAAGSTNVVELHGTAHRSECIGARPAGGTPNGCGWSSSTRTVLARIDDGEDDPMCPDCDGLVKAATVSFGQAMDRGAVDRAVEAVLTADLVVTIGTSLQVFPAASLVPEAARGGIPVVIMNAEPTPFDRLADAVVRGRVEQVLPGIVAGLDPVG